MAFTVLINAYRHVIMTEIENLTFSAAAIKRQFTVIALLNTYYATSSNLITGFG